MLRKKDAIDDEKEIEMPQREDVVDEGRRREIRRRRSEGRCKGDRV